MADALIERLREALRSRDEVELAIAFGSRARGRATAASDLDVAVRGGDRMALAADLSLALGVEVDVVELDAATIPLLEALVRDGVVVHEARKQAAAGWRTVALATLETDRPWFARMRDAWLARVAGEALIADRDLVAAKLADLVDRIARVRSRCPDTAEALAADRDALDLVSFNLMLAVQACADIASHVIADEEWAAATTLAESFMRLEQHGVVSTATATALGRAVGLRNIVAHGYAGVDPTIVHRAAQSGVADLDTFAREVAAWVGAR